MDDKNKNIIGFVLATGIIFGFFILCWNVGSDVSLLSSATRDAEIQYFTNVNDNMNGTEKYEMIIKITNEVFDNETLKNDVFFDASILAYKTDCVYKLIQR